MVSQKRDGHKTCVAQQDVNQDDQIQEEQVNDYTSGTVRDPITPLTK